MQRNFVMVLGGLALLGVLAVGCGGSKKHLRSQGALDLSCPERQVRVSLLSRTSGIYLAEGCGRRLQYRYSRGGIPEMISGAESPTPSTTPPEVPGSEVPPPPPPPP